MPTVPRDNSAARDRSKASGLRWRSWIAPLHHFTFTHIGDPDLPDVSSPTADDGCRTTGAWQSCRRAVAMWLPTPVSRHPRDPVQRVWAFEVRHGPGCRQRSARQSPASCAPIDTIMFQTVPAAAGLHRYRYSRGMPSRPGMCMKSKVMWKPITKQPEMPLAQRSFSILPVIFGYQ